MSNEQQETSTNQDAILLQLEQEGFFPQEETTEATESATEVESQKTETVESKDKVETKSEESEKVEVTEETKEEPDKNKSLAEQIADEEQLTPRILDLKRRENDIRKREKELSDREKELSSTKPKKDTEYISSMELLNKYGFTAEDVMNELLGTQNQTEQKPQADKLLLKRLEALEKYKKDTVEKEEENKKTIAATEQKRQAEEYATNLNKFLTDNAEKYQLINKSDSQQFVLDTIVEYYNLTGESLPWEQAAKRCENQLEDELSDKVKDLLNVESIKNKLNLNITEQATTTEEKKVVTEQPEKPEAKEAPDNGLKTLSNNNTSSTMSDSADEIDEEERIRQATMLEAQLFR